MPTGSRPSSPVAPTPSTGTSPAIANAPPTIVRPDGRWPRAAQNHPSTTTGARNSTSRAVATGRRLTATK